MLISAPLLHLFGRQLGVAADVDLLQHLTKRQLKRALLHKVLTCELPGVKRLAGVPEDVPSRIMALCAFAREDGFVSGMTAARQLGVECVPYEYLELMIHERRSPMLPKWVKVTRSSWRIEEDTHPLADGRVVSSPLRTLFRCASTCSNVRFEKIAEQLWHRRLITPTEAAEYLALVRRRGRGGVSRFELWLEKAVERPRPSQSALEVDLAAAVVAAGLPPPERQYELRLGNEVIHLDLCWPAVRLGLEPGHTFWHGGEEKVRSDHARDRGCDELGWRILRFDEVELRDMLGCVRQVVKIYHQRANVR